MTCPHGCAIVLAQGWLSVIRQAYARLPERDSIAVAALLDMSATKLSNEELERLPEMLEEAKEAGR